MTDQHPPHEQSDPSDPEPIIELTDVVASPHTSDDDIIELTDVVETDAAADDDVIELTEVVESAPAEEEPVIELTEVVTAEEVHPESDLVVEPETDTAVIESAFELSEEKESRLEDVEDTTSSDLAFAEMDLDIEDHPDEELFDSMGLNLEADLLNASEDPGELDFNLSTQELSDAIDLLDAKLAEEPVKPPPPEKEAIDLPASLAPDQLESALENVIRKMFAEKIDALLNEAIEKTVSTEITRLKEQLLGDHPDKP